MPPWGLPLDHKGPMRMENTDHHQARSDIYRLLAAAFYPPERDLLLEENLSRNLEKLFQAVCPPAVTAATQMETAMQHEDDAGLKVEHAALFVGPFEMKAAPYGSLYLESTGRLMGNTTMEVRSFYQKDGLELELQDVPDHIAFELEFMGYLAGQEAQSQLDGDNAQASHWKTRRAEFMNRYLAPWIPAFTSKIRGNTKSKFYLGLADCLEYFIACDYKKINGGQKEKAAA